MGATTTYAALLQAGLAYEGWITLRLLAEGIVLLPYETRAEQTQGENRLGLEIKHDRNVQKTNNLFIETSEITTAGEWVPSGIYRDDNTWLYGIGDHQRFWVFGLKHLRSLVTAYRSVDNGRTRGHILPVAVADREAERTFLFA